MPHPRLVEVAALEGHDGRVWGVAWSPDGSTLASCGADRTVRLWTRGSGRDWACAATLDGPASRAVRCLAWSPCGSRLAAASFDATTVVWEREGPAPASSWVAAAVLQGHESEVKGAAWSPSGSHLATCARDKSVWVWEAVPDGGGGTEYECADVKQGHTADVKAVAWHPAPEAVTGCAAPGGGVLVSASYDETLRVWADAGDEWVCAQVLGVGDGGHAGTVWCLSFEGGGHAGGGRPPPRLASGGGDGSVRVWACPPRPAGAAPDDDFAWRVSQALDGAHGDRPVYAVAWAPPAGAGRARLASAGGDDALRLWEEGGGGDGGGGGGGGALVQVASASSTPPSEINGLAWCPAGPEGGRLLATAGDDGVVRVWAVVEAGG